MASFDMSLVCAICGERFAHYGYGLPSRRHGEFVCCEEVTCSKAWDALIVVAKRQTKESEAYRIKAIENKFLEEALRKKKL